jgi:hypothetical protein
MSMTRRSGSKELPSGCLALFFLSFAVVGGGILWFLLLRPAMKVLAAQSWTPVECTVAESRVDTSSSDDGGSTYKVLVKADYTFDDHHHQAPYDFSGSVYSSGYDGKAQIVARYPVGAHTTCYVNPAKPEESVISRQLVGSYFFGLTGLIFFLPGIIGFFWALGGGPKRSEQAVKLDPGAPFGVANPQGDVSGPVELKAKVTPLGRLLGLFFASLVWNGITWTIAWFAVFQQQKAEGCVMVFLAVFALIGLLLIYGMFRQALVLFNPRPRLTLSPGSLQLGELGYLQWRLTGATGGARRLLVTLEGKEEVRYRRGTDTHTETQVFTTIPIVDSSDSYQMLAGSTSFTVPSDTLPSFASANNKVIWTLKAKLDIANWPDSEEEFEILVRP